MTDLSFLQQVAFAYALLVLFKTFICWASLPTATRAFCDMRNISHYGLVFAMFAVLVPFITLFMAVPLLVQERLHFFRCYTAEEVGDEVESAL